MENINKEIFSGIERPKLSPDAATAIMERVRIKARRERILKSVIWISAGVIAAVAMILIIPLLIDVESIFSGLGRNTAGIFTSLTAALSTVTAKTAMAITAILLAYSIIGDTLSRRLDEKAKE